MSKITQRTTLYVPSSQRNPHNWKPGFSIGWLTIKERTRIYPKNDTSGHKSRAGWRCQCRCGNIVDIRTDSLKYGTILSCGCFSGKHLKYPQRDDKTFSPYHKIYSRWRGIFQRCYNPNNPKFKNYGGRGITVCEEWHDYFNFKKWYLKKGFNVFGEDNRTTDRIDVNGNYEPDNCRLADVYTQAANKQNTQKVLVDGEWYTLGELVKRYPTLNTRMIQGRIQSGLKGKELVAPRKTHTSRDRVGLNYTKNGSKQKKPDLYVLWKSHVFFLSELVEK